MYCTKSQSSRMSASRRGVNYVKPLHELAGRGVSASFSSDDSDNEFEFSEVYSHEPPASPKLQNFAPPWDSVASSNADTVFIAQLSAQHQHGSAKDAGVDIVGASGRSIHSGIIASADQIYQKKRVDLRSLMLERRELEQLPPLASAGHRMEVVDADQKPNLSSSSSSSSSASSSKSSSISSTVSYSSPQCNLHDGKKSRRWSVKLDFLHMNKASPSKGAVDLRHHIDHITATTDELGDTIHNDAGVVVDYDNAIFESPTKCLTSSISSSAVKREKNIIRGALSAPVSPARSPSRGPFSPAKGPVAHSANGHLQAPRSTTGLKIPLSPHAQHYQRQKARAEELRRRTFLPYRQSLFGGCFFQSPPGGHPQVAC